LRAEQSRRVFGSRRTLIWAKKVSLFGESDL
jgi:hypothetical protein